MKRQPSQSDEFAVFQGALRRVLRVSKDDLNRMLEEEKRVNAGKPKRGPKPKRPSVSDPAASEND